MIEKIFITSFCVFAIWYTMQVGEVFGFVEKWWRRKEEALSKEAENAANESNLEEYLRIVEKKNFITKISQPISRCPVCMNFWHGTYIYWLIWGCWLKTGAWQEWPIIVIAGIGFNAIVVKLWPPTDEGE